MKNELISKIINSMIAVLDSEQISYLKTQLYISMNDYELNRKETNIVPYDNNNILFIQKFIAAKIAAGKSKNTTRIYASSLKFAFSEINKRIEDIDEDDIRMFLYRYQVERGNKLSTVKNMWAYLSSFFVWLRKNKYISENPMDLVEHVKTDHLLKKPFTDEEIAEIKDHCKNIRDRALVDFLDASMVRVGELQKLNRNDVTFMEKECVVYGKGGKERIAYFSGEAKIHLEEYLDSRKDDNKALFVGLKAPYNRLTIGGIQELVRRIGKSANVSKVHPHRFRRTGASRLLRRSVPIEIIQQLLGHSQISTTTKYAIVDKRAVKFKYQSAI